MNLRLALVAAISVVFTSAFAQTRLNLFTESMLRNSPPDKTAIDLFVRGEVNAVKEAVQAAKGNYKFGYGEYNSVTIPLVSLDAFLKSSAIRAVENGERKMVPLTDTAIIVNCVLPVHNGDAPLNASYLGDGIIVGVIDYGIDITHQDFKKSNGDTRIRYLWDQYDNDGTKPFPYNYGSEWTEFQINAGQCAHVESDASGHGTNVAGIAAGNGRGCNTANYTGMAPNADLIIVSFNFDEAFLSTFMDAVDYIFKKADAMGKPCVINASLGAYWGSHDGKDMAGLLVNSLLEERGGRMLVCAAGNAGDLAFHLGYDVTADTSFTWFTYYAPRQHYYYDFWADTADFNDVYFAVGTDNPAGWKHLAHTTFFNVKQDFFFSPSGNGEDMIDYKLYQLRDSSSNYLGNVNLYVTLSQGRYNIEVEIEGPHNPNHYWSFITTGSGRVDGWHSSITALAIESSDAVTVLPDTAARHDIVHYKLPDATQNIVSSYTCSDHVLAVGNFTNRASFINCNGGSTINASPAGQIFGNSSRGPNRLGLTKPDVSATGDFTVTSSNTSFSFGAGILGQCCNYRRNGGTSMASPIVAGIAALYLQKYPDADWRQIREAIILTSKSDSFTGTVPNNAYGHGKVVACDAMMVNLKYGCTDPTALNYDSLAELDDGTCIPVDSGCTDPTAFNYDTLANVDDGNCVPRIYGCADTLALNYDTTANTNDGSCFYVGIGSIVDENIKLAFIPNFFRNETNIVYSFEKPLSGKTTVVLTNLLGQQTDEIVLPQSKGSIAYRPALGEPGVYFYHLINEGKTLLSGKLVIY